jgi:hypothetical protein
MTEPPIRIEVFDTFKRRNLKAKGVALKYDHDKIL